MDPELGKITAQVTKKKAEPLLPALIKKFLCWGAAKEKTDAESERRGGSKDRRVSSVSQRLRTGFCIEYFRQTGAGKFDLVLLTHKTRDDLARALTAEAARYHFTGRSSGKVLEPSIIIDAALDVLWGAWLQRPESKNQAVLLLGEIADLLSKYKISKIDRREQQRGKALRGGREQARS
jgi:hypothetical protein